MKHLHQIFKNDYGLDTTRTKFVEVKYLRLIFALNSNQTGFQLEQRSHSHPVMKIYFSYFISFILLFLTGSSLFAADNKCILLFDSESIISKPINSAEKTIGKEKKEDKQTIDPSQTPEKLAARHQLFSVLKDKKMAAIDQIPKNWNGLTKVLIPGLSRSSLFYEVQSHFLLAAGFRVIRPDPFNIGKTLQANTPASQKNLSLEHDGKAIAEIIHSLNLPDHSVELIGHSRGAGVTIKAALAMDRRLISRISLANPFVRWLSYYAEKDLAHNISSNFELMNLMTNPFAVMHRPTAQFLKGLADYWANISARNTMAVVESSGDNYFRNFIKDKLEHRPQEEQTGLNLNDEVNGVMNSFNNLKNVSILPEAKQLAALAKEFGFDIRVLTTDKDDLVPRQAGQDLRDALNIQNHSVQDRREVGDHYFPSNRLHDFVNWLLEP